MLRLCSHSGSCSRFRLKLQTAEASFLVSVETQVLDCWDLVFGLSRDSSSRLLRLCSHSGSCFCLRLKSQTVKSSFLVSVETQVPDCQDLVLILDLVFGQDSSSRLSRLPCLKIIWKREIFFSLPVFWIESSVATSCVSRNKFFVFSCQFVLNKVTFWSLLTKIQRVKKKKLLQKQCLRRIWGNFLWFLNHVWIEPTSPSKQR